jgi:hypothetical protein
MPTRDFYTLPEAAQILDAPQRSLLKSLETGEIEGELDPQSGRWKIPKQAVDERVSAESSPEDTAEESQGQSAEMLRELVGEMGDLHRLVGHLRSRLDRARRTEREERENANAQIGCAKKRVGCERKWRAPRGPGEGSLAGRIEDYSRPALAGRRKKGVKDPRPC